MKKILTLSLLTLLFFQGCAALSSTTITGRIIVKGQAPHTFIALKVRNRTYINVVGRLKRVLQASYQGKKITLQGRFLSEANGLSEPARFEATKVLEILER